MKNLRLLTCPALRRTKRGLGWAKKYLALRASCFFISITVARLLAMLIYAKSKLRLLAARAPCIMSKYLVVEIWLTQARRAK